MPTSTFFRLPEEKRQRLIEASWEEFTRASFSDVSINAIIRSAGIPRGSFYQYFLDKEDLFFYLLDEMRQYFSKSMERLLEEAGGDLFALPLRAFDQFVRERGSMDPVLARCIRVMRVNRGLDIQRLMGEKPKCLTDGLWERMDLSAFRQQDRAFVGNAFFLLIMALASTVMEVLQAPDQWEGQRARLRSCIDIIQTGSTGPDRAREQGGDQC